MPRQISKEKADLLASIYCTNGYKKTEALIEAGYSVSYANSGTGINTYENIRVKEAIARIEAVHKLKSDYTIEAYYQDLERIIGKAEADKIYSVAMTGVIAKGRGQGYDKDNDMADAVKPLPLDADLKTLLQQQAKTWEEAKRKNIKIDRTGT